MSEKSLLTEPINPELLDDSQVFTVKLLDQSGTKFFYEETVKLKNIYEFDLTRFVPNDKHTDLERFFKIAAEVIDNAQSREGTVDSQKVQLVEDFNIEEFHTYGDEVIAWKLIKREPAKMDVKANSRPQRRPLYSYNLHSPEYPNKVIVVESMPIDHIIEFSIWSKTAAKANKRALWLERLFLTHSWAFTSKGVERFFWQSRGTDTMLTAGRQRLFQRPLRYFVRLREFHSIAYPTIQSINFDVTIK